MLGIFYIFCLLKVVCHAAANLEASQYCFDGCKLTLNYLHFNDTSHVHHSKKVQDCESTLRTTSLYICVLVYCKADGRIEWIEKRNLTCQRLGNVTLPSFDQVLAGWTQDEIAGVRRFSGREGLESPTLNEVAIPDESFFLRAFKTIETAMFEYEIHRHYGWVMYWFWAAVIAFGIIIRLAMAIQGIGHHDRLAFSSGEHEWDCDTGLAHKDHTFRDLLKRYITIPATFGYRCSQNVWWCTIPPRIQSLTILSFVTINIFFCCSSYRLTEGNLYWPRKSDQMWRYISDRTGILALMNFPLIWLFGTRNNTFLWLTGWGFGAYNIFHRWVARVATLQAAVHSIGYTVMIIQDGGLAHLKKYLFKHYIWNGELATIFICAISAFSVYGFRRSHYEIFLVAHISLSAVVLLTMYYHVEIFTDCEWNVFIWPCLLIWIFDRFMRVFRILTFSARIWNTRCDAIFSPESNLVRLEIPCSQSLLAPKPGTYYHLYVLNDLAFAHQNHPFTLAYVTPGKDQVYSQSYSRYGAPQSLFRRPASIESNESESLLPLSGSPSLVFLIRPYDGFTSRLQRMVTSSSKSSRSLRVLVEGPYGDTYPLHTFSSVLFIVGGTGIAVPLSYLERLTASDSRAINVHIVWAVRNHALLVEVLKRDLRYFVKNDRLHLTVHVTRERNPENDIPVRDLGIMNLTIGRPKVHSIVEEETEGEKSGHGRLAVLACGPAQMADDARRACVCALKRGSKGLEFFEESFKW